MEMYFRECPACNCFEYDCRGEPGCIKLEDDYQNAAQRYKERQAKP